MPSLEFLVSRHGSCLYLLEPIDGAGKVAWILRTNDRTSLAQIDLRIWRLKLVENSIGMRHQLKLLVKISHASTCLVEVQL